MTATQVEHQPRERAVPCTRCRKVETWAIDAICERCSSVAPKPVPFRDSRLPARFWKKVDPNGPWSLFHHVPGRCWVWTAATLPAGYGKAYFERRYVLTHRLSYQLLVGSIPDGLELDHLCRNTSCVNPAHLEPVTDAENSRRAALARTHCPQGHPYSEQNTMLLPGSYRRCRSCRKEQAEAWVEARHPAHLHGTAGYTHGCRCDICSAARREYDRSRRPLSGVAS